MNDLSVPPGAMLMVGLPGVSLDPSTCRLIEDFQVNNFILFRRNYVDPVQLKALCRELRAVCLERGLSPPLISIDQEGGSVIRLGAPFTQFPDARVLADADEPETEVRNFAVITAKELLKVGINMNLAPVLDVCEAGQGFFMERRSLGNDPGRVSRFGWLIIETMQKSGVAACGKHFPGLGGARQDPHKLLPVVDIPRQELFERDLMPFIKAARAGVASIMTSHTIYPALDSDRPATLSRAIITSLLREEIGFDGLVITDDLEMGAIENEGRVEEAAWQAFQAGADLLLICEGHDKVERTVKRLDNGLARNSNMSRRLQQSVDRIRSVQRRFATA